MSAARRRTALTSRRPARLALATAAAALLIVVLAVLVRPSDDTPDSTRRSPAADTTTPIPERRLDGPAKLPEPQGADVATKAILAASVNAGAIRRGGGRRPLVALTFDDGPGPDTARVVAILRRTKTPATFFQVGRNIDAYPYPARATMLLDRVALGDHTYTHRLLKGVDLAGQRQELISNAATMMAHGEGAPRIFRPPYGGYDATTQQLMAQRGMAMVLWSVDSRDFARPGVGRIVRTVMEWVTPGAIVLLHDGGGDRTQTVEALPRIVKALRARGYGLVTVPELLRRDPPRRARPSRGRQG